MITLINLPVVEPKYRRLDSGETGVLDENRALLLRVGQSSPKSLVLFIGYRCPSSVLRSLVREWAMLATRNELCGQRVEASA